MAPLEPWEKVLVDMEAYAEDAHAEISCIECHQGINDSNKGTAHADIIKDPSVNPEGCADCHDYISQINAHSLHTTQTGYWTAIDARSVPEDHPAMEEMFDNHCATCHTSCGQCHVSQPTSVGGGFVKGHVFKKTPSMTKNCTACHGSRVGNEYLGKNEGIKADVHFRQGRMQCVDCHNDLEMHGAVSGSNTVLPLNRYDGSQMPTCESCHEEAASGNDDIDMHKAHEDRLSCQVCHSVTYTSCDGCHVSIGEKSGAPIFRTEATYPTFFIGKNPLKNEQRPYDYVPVRHIPVSPDTYAFYTGHPLQNFDALPTWAYATPHNIQLDTPQTESCDACHNNTAYFLTSEKVSSDELTANMNVIVQAPPPAVGGMPGAATPYLPDTHKDFQVCFECHLSGYPGIPLLPENHATFSEEKCVYCHLIPQQ